jgi:hypothetical protein
VLQIGFANITPAEAAQFFQQTGISGTVVPSLGFGSWGIEPGALVMIADERDHATAEASAVRLLKERKEEAALHVRDGRAGLLWSSGNVEPFPGLLVNVA